jgi:endonuclease/exonuclease/phosphatase family metal-dependent hydrolase
VLSWNVHGLPYPLTNNRDLRMKRIAERIEAERPDVVALQESWPGSVGPLEAALRSYSMHYAPTSFGNASGGLIFLVRREGAFRADGPSLRFHPYSRYAPWYRIWEADGLAGKGALFLPVVREDGTRVWIVNTHLQARYGTRDYRVVRRAQLRELRSWIDSLGDTQPVVIAGDLNTSARIDVVYDELDSIGIDHAFLLHESSTTTKTYPPGSTKGWIDYVLVRPHPFTSRGNITLIKNERKDYPYSDHNGLMLDLELLPPPRK